MMRHKIQITLIALVFSYAAGAQSLVLSYQGTNLPPNAEITVDGPVSEFEIVAYLAVQNTNNYDIPVLVRRYEFSMVPGTQSALCWGLCYPPTINLSPYNIIIPAGTTNTTDFAGHYYPDGNAGLSSIGFVFFDENDPNDSVMVTINYNAMITGIREQPTSVAHVYPNPANEFVNIELNRTLQPDAYIELLSVTGAVAAIRTLEQSTATIQTSGIPGGLYFYRIVSGAEVLESGRLIIKH
ncbi:MAG: T9SS type A sorting domain-containing protein [Bacteroidales bacterium]